MSGLTCPTCNGTKTVPLTIIDIIADFECPKCDGRGIIFNEIINNLYSTEWLNSDWFLEWEKLMYYHR